MKKFMFILISGLLITSANSFAKEHAKKADGRKPNAFSECDSKAVAIAEAIYKADITEPETAAVTPIQTGVKGDVVSYDVSFDTGNKFDLIYKIKLGKGGSSCYFISATQAKF